MFWVYRMVRAIYRLFNIPNVGLLHVNSSRVTHSGPPPVTIDVCDGILRF